MRYLVLILLLSTVFTSLFTMTIEQKQNLLELSQRFSEKAIREKQEVEDFARQNNIPIRKEFDNGKIVELIRLENGRPVYYTTMNADGAAYIKASRVYPGGGAGLNLTGSGQILGIWDGGSTYTAHQALTGRVTIGDTYTIGGHATHVGGTMIASGQYFPNAQGMSYQAQLKSYDWNDDNAEMASEAVGGMKVSNHSYGIIAGWSWGDWSGTEAWHWFGSTGISTTEDYNFGFYNSDTAAWDLIARNAPNYLIVKSAGNDRGEGPEPGTSHYYNYRNGSEWVWGSSTDTREKDGGTEGYDSMPTNSVAKNILTVGAVDNTDAMSSFSGWGPTDDGRIKPDIVAKGVSVVSTYINDTSSYGGMSGTSMSSPMVSGAIGLLLQHQENLHPGQAMHSSTMKALVIHTADDMISGVAGPDYRFGWGLMDTEKAAQVMTDNKNNDFEIQELSLTNNETIEFLIKAKGDEPLRATIVWTDVEGTPPGTSLNPTSSMLVNDLDLRLFSSGTEISPYILDPSNPSNIATTGDNFRDNVEMIHIASPVGNQIYTVKISHKGTLNSGLNQDFSLIVTGAEKASLAPTVGTGDSGSPYEISSLSHLYWIAEDSSRWDKHYLQTGNIDATETNSIYEAKGWKPIGNETIKFTGTYSGGGHYIDNLFINRTTEDNIGLFGYTNGATINQLELRNVNITGQDNVGALIGYNYNGSNVELCFVNQGNVVGRDNTGGLIGYNYHSCNISESYTYCQVSGYDYVGNFVGFNYASDITKSYSSGTVAGMSNLGGFVGKSHTGSINNSYNRANISRLSGAVSTNIGGFVGSVNNSTIEKSYNTGNITYLSGSITNDKGFAGYVDSGSPGTYNGNYFDIDLSQQTSDINGTATGKTTTNMTSDALLVDYTDNIYLNAGWDFAGESYNGNDNIWNIGNSRNNGYPYHKWQYPTDDSTLPVTLSSFTASYTVSNTISLNWTTQSETNIIGYHIFKAETNSLNQAQRISANIIRAYNQAVEQDYNFVDNSIQENTEYYYWLQSLEYDGSTEFHGPIYIVTGSTAETIPEIPFITQLHNAYPNPFNPHTSISFDIAEDTTVNLDVFNIKGQHIRTLLNQFLPAGRYVQVWDGKDKEYKPQASGVYFFKMQANKYYSIKKVILMK